MTGTNSSTELFNRELCDFLDHSPTPFHAVSTMSAMLEKAGFSALSETEQWSLEAGGKYFVTRNGSSIIAFTVGTESMAETGIRMAGAHTDSPCLMVKPQPELLRNQYFQLGVEVYGGALLNPSYHRHQSIAARLVYRDSSGQLKQKLFKYEKPVDMIPSLATIWIGRLIPGALSMPRRIFRPF